MNNPLTSFLLTHSSVPEPSSSERPAYQVVTGSTLDAATPWPFPLISPKICHTVNPLSGNCLLVAARLAQALCRRPTRHQPASSHPGHRRLRLSIQFRTHVQHPSSSHSTVTTRTTMRCAPQMGKRNTSSILRNVPATPLSLDVEKAHRRHSRLASTRLTDRLQRSYATGGSRTRLRLGMDPQMTLANCSRRRGRRISCQKSIG